MFAESMLESGNVRHKGRGLATTLSITIQTLLIAALVALPMFRPDALPLQIRAMAAPIALGSPDVPPDPHPERSSAAPTNRSEFTQPTEIPSGPVANQPVSEQPPASCVPFCSIGPRSGQPDGVPGLFPTINAATPPVLAAKPPERVVVSQMQLGGLISQARPVYPAIAISTHTEGTVMLRALIDRSGRITNVQVISGHPLLQQAAKSAVEQWRYRPYVLNGVPVDVETQITVNFRLGR